MTTDPVDRASLGWIALLLSRDRCTFGDLRAELADLLTGVGRHDQARAALEPWPRSRWYGEDADRGARERLALFRNSRELPEIALEQSGWIIDQECGPRPVGVDPHIFTWASTRSERVACRTRRWRFSCP